MRNLRSTNLQCFLTFRKMLIHFCDALYIFIWKKSWNWIKLSIEFNSWIVTTFIGGWGSAPGPAGGAHDTPPPPNRFSYALCRLIKFCILQCAVLFFPYFRPCSTMWSSLIVLRYLTQIFKRPSAGQSKFSVATLLIWLSQKFSQWKRLDQLFSGDSS